MIRINQLKLNIAHTQSDLERKILKTLHMKKEYLQGYKIRRQSIDARKKPDLYYVYSVDVLVKDEAKIKKSIKSNQIQFQAKEDTYNFPANGTREFKHRPVIIGTGPAGLFCGYMLAIHGYRPILLERGADVDQRTKDVETFWKTGTLDPSSNVQFGEGGAGTFSDGKLNTCERQIREEPRSSPHLCQTWCSGSDHISKQAAYRNRYFVPGCKRNARMYLCAWRRSTVSFTGH